MGCGVASGEAGIEARWGWFGSVRIIIDRVVVTWFETGTNLEFGSDQKLRF